MAAAAAEPRNPDALANRRGDGAFACHVHDANDLVARNDRQACLWQLTVDQMQVRAADAAGLDADPYLATTGQRIGALFEYQWHAD